MTKPDHLGAALPTTELGPATTASMPPARYLPGRLGFADMADIDEFVDTLERYERGELSGEAWRAFRLVRGVYGQRQPDVQMLRVKIPQGVLTAAQLDALAEVAERYAKGRCHVTTRQNLQLYEMRLCDVEAAMRRLAEAGLTTREACGHSVRNVTACPLAGVDPSEVFDVTPYADALTRHLLRGPRSSTLPRKFKIAFEGCDRDCVRAAINDLAFVARRDLSGTPGFVVLAGGGLATLPRSAGTLVEFLPASELLVLGDAVVNVFHREGDRKNKHKARLKWVIERLGFAAFRDAVLAEWAMLRQAGAPPLSFDPLAPPVAPLPSPGLGLAWYTGQDPDRGDDRYGAFTAWRRSNVVAQKQTGFAAATVTLPLGDLEPQALRALAVLCRQLGDGTVRTTVDQNLLLRNVPLGALPTLYQRLHAYGLGGAGAGAFSDVVSCPGADTCAIAVTASRGMARLLRDHLHATPELGLDTDGAHINVSGCPNGCGQHHLATIGLQGGLRKIGGRALPVYHLTIGGNSNARVARFGRLLGKVPARRGPAVVERLLALWQRDRRANETLDCFLERVPIEVARAAVADLLEIDERSATAQDFVDLGQAAPFVVGSGESECAA